MIKKIHRHFRGEIHQDLPASPARRTKIARTGNNRNSSEVAFSLAESLEERHALRTNCEAVGRTFNVVPCNDFPALGFYGGSNLKVRVRRNRFVHGVFEQRVAAGQVLNVMLSFRILTGCKRKLNDTITPKIATESLTLASAEVAFVCLASLIVLPLRGSKPNTSRRKAIALRL
ncbi:MAG: hypothetical protein RML35_13540 [Chloroherpetonaceae bacterium]|nr:hypothetical protein [Chloroherpetonaceae bacterium]